ncbi:MAG: type II toxin-antitoxin system Phd/YefM family antitoxin [Candidatus Omnitrophota bacterium]|nr:type II toxin-antitoxin system Phd/YefM family antitoxin [Candidatus Omnitrophota bacterium]
MVRTITTREFRTHLADVLNDVVKRFDRYVISKRGKPEAILMCVDDYEGWLETIEIMSSKKVLKDIEAAKRELRQGKGYSFDEVFSRVRHNAKRRHS